MKGGDVMKNGLAATLFAVAGVIYIFLGGVNLGIFMLGLALLMAAVDYDYDYNA